MIVTRRSRPTPSRRSRGRACGLPTTGRPRIVSAGHAGAWGPSVGASLAFGCVQPEHAVPGTELEVVVPGEGRPARVLAEARHDPGNSRPRA